MDQDAQLLYSPAPRWGMWALSKEDTAPDLEGPEAYSLNQFKVRIEI